MDFRNAHYNAAGTIDMEIMHPTWGWIPFTAAPNDVATYTADLFIRAKDIAAPYVPPAPTFQPLPRLAFWLVAAQIGVTKAAVLAQIEAMPDGLDKEIARVYVEEAQTYHRDDPHVIMFSELNNIPSAQLDTLWLWAQTGG